MPATDTRAQPANRELAAKLISTMKPRNEVAIELAELRREIAALRALLSPAPSLILTGQAVIDQFNLLRK